MQTCRQQTVVQKVGKGMQKDELSVLSSEVMQCISVFGWNLRNSRSATCPIFSYNNVL